ncbi:hypothetical protein ACS49_04480 [Bacillus cereus]|nr:hypothetical protein ACS49_04480 [Bacillus cereus]
MLDARFSLRLSLSSRWRLRQNRNRSRSPKSSKAPRIDPTAIPAFAPLLSPVDLLLALEALEDDAAADAEVAVATDCVM